MSKILSIRSSIRHFTGPTDITFITHHSFIMFMAECIQKHFSFVKNANECDGAQTRASMSLSLIPRSANELTKASKQEKNAPQEIVYNKANR